MMSSCRIPGKANTSAMWERLAFFLATDALKEISRANWVRSGARTETVAEHCWHVTLLAMLFADAAPEGTDHDHVRNLLTIHDLVEVYAGDTVFWDDVPLADVGQREHAAGERLMAMLPESQRPRFDPLWREFQAQETVEARFARAVDVLHPLLVSWSLRGKGHQNTTLSPVRILSRKRPFLEAFPPLWELAQQVVQDAVNHGLLPPDEMVARQETLDGRNPSREVAVQSGAATAVRPVSADADEAKDPDQE